MKTTHRVYFENSERMPALPAGSVDLIVTSPPYPMIEMWDGLFTRLSQAARDALTQQQGFAAFDAMHRVLDPVWEEAHRVLRPGGFACINIGDATRTLGDAFMLYPNHSRILTRCIALGFTPLPAILWRKQTNSPNKFMGSGMLPAGAYVTLEHELILVLRKGPKREFTLPEEKQLRRESAIFWEERNLWYSDVWFDLKGARQGLGKGEPRRRSGAFPFELAYRLISMFSAKGDTVLDPFLGTGTTLKAAAAAARNSIGFEIEPDFAESVFHRISEIVGFANERVRSRIDGHIDFIRQCRDTGRTLKHLNRRYGFPVVTRQETELFLNLLADIHVHEKHGFEVSYSDAAGPVSDLPAVSPAGDLPPKPNHQLELFARY
ncbi:MAG TPA: site-specific DNA-methyltransferase [Desulfobacterales bacterium]|nr:site-specific DNA-methyltransferase [Desulfobacterales bacterium]